MCLPLPARSTITDVQPGSVLVGGLRNQAPNQDCEGPEGQEDAEEGHEPQGPCSRREHQPPEVGREPPGE